MTALLAAAVGLQARCLPLGPLLRSLHGLVATRQQASRWRAWRVKHRGCVSIPAAILKWHGSARHGGPLVNTQVAGYRWTDGLLVLVPDDVPRTMRTTTGSTAGHFHDAVTTQSAWFASSLGRVTQPQLAKRPRLRLARELNSTLPNSALQRPLLRRGESRADLVNVRRARPWLQPRAAQPGAARRAPPGVGGGAGGRGRRRGAGAAA